MTSSWVLAAVAALLAQTTPVPSPTASTCPPTEVKRVRPTNAPDPELPYSGHDNWCKGVSCFVVDVVVTVNPDGTVKSAVERGSWGAGTDYVATKAARESKYIPATANCRPVEGTYIFREMFTVHRDDQMK